MKHNTMKRYHFLCAVVLPAALLLFTSCVKEPEIIKVMAYNIRLSIVDDGENHWNIRKPGSVLMINT